MQLKQIIVSLGYFEHGYQIKYELKANIQVYTTKFPRGSVSCLQIKSGGFKIPNIWVHKNMLLVNSYSQN